MYCLTYLVAILFIFSKENHTLSSNNCDDWVIINDLRLNTIIGNHLDNRRLRSPAIIVTTLIPPNILFTKTSKFGL